MDILKEHVEQKQDILYKTLREIILDIANSYTPQNVNNVKYEIHIDKESESVIINSTSYNL